MRQALCILVAAALNVTAQQPAQERLAAVRQSIARNQARLKQYQWTESTEISVKGKVKSMAQNECHFGPNGLVRTPIGGRPADAKPDDRIDRLGSLLRRYLPLQPDTMRAAFQAGKANLDPASGVIEFRDYAKPGDKAALAFDPAARRIRSFDVTTYLDDPADRVTLTAQFSTLPDGTNFLEQYVLDASGKQIRIKTVNFGHHK